MGQTVGQPYLEKYWYRYPPPCFSTRACFKLSSFFSSLASEKTLRISSSIFYYLLLRGHRPFHCIPCVAPPPPFRHQKTTEKKSVNKKCFFQTSVSPGPPKCLRKRPQKRSAAALFSDFPFSAELWFRTTLRWFSYFYWFQASLLQPTNHEKHT